ncbi:MULTISPECIES: OadG family protein [Stutzerimonas]|jgi:oxaloacetate decarboxylase gamma subunit|uniref:OadG family protein n=1 Tax=Stutzerimonas TaxID=2901164 RepID=UPI000F798DB7|nr:MULTISPECIES: OadG family transporter subunit [Stutzerimonas]MCQ2032234.1 OadG family transporter subunit [Stutzerimonas zhaodongensis]MCW8158340.1 oxaloacetate decarboxylase [Stutzerimonas stutzeri]RRU70575.1 oxaloacetate decarboxylase [Stutzerimonas xanthomarina]RRU91175.1 oxaloacetate decarboxylase [Stutzerimonas xanthomarina]
MTSNQLLWEGVELMLFGIGSVFVFLVLLIYCIRLMSFCVGRFEPAPSPAVRTAPSPAASIELSGDELSAIQSAIHQHRARRG